MLNWLVEESIAPHIPVFDKSKRDDGTLSRGSSRLRRYRCGAQAANDLDAFIASRLVSCIPISLYRYGRTVATCSVVAVPISASGLCGTG
jgi:hypothetical protein